MKAMRTVALSHAIKAAWTHPYKRILFVFEYGLGLYDRNYG